jgi:iron complex outermembrane receptor protein
LGIFPGGPIGPSPNVPIVTVENDRSTQTADVEQIRAVAGIRGDMPWLSFGSLDNWSFEAAVVWAESDGTSIRPGIRDDRLDLAVGAFSITGTPCDNSFNIELSPTAEPGCVPVDMYAASLATPVGGDFATQAERDYLFDSHNFRTKYEQLLGSVFVTGDLFELPAGPVGVVIGYEYRDDTIESIPNEVARDGLLTAFFADGGATGTKFTEEWYAELELPLLANMAAASELTVNLSGRYTRDELYGSDNTYSGKIGWRPVDSLLIRGTYGTSFRAPNLRENFLVDQTGFGDVFDPCVTSPDAVDPISGDYIPSQDPRDPAVIENCRQVDGIEPGEFVRAVPVYNVEIASAGVSDIEAETSDSWSLGFAFEQPWFESFDMTLGVTYYEIEIENAIIEPSPSFIVGDCYTKETFDSVFCERIRRDGLFLDFIDSGFINRDSAIVEGYDINVAIDKTATIFSRPVDFGIDLTLNRGIENSTLFVASDGTEDYDDDQGEWGLPDWRGQLGIRADVGDFRLTWQARYLGPVAEDPDSVDDFSDVMDGQSSTCLGPLHGDVQCRDVGFAGSYVVNNMSLYYYGDVWTLGAGIRNVFEKSPPRVDQDRNFISLNSVQGVVLGQGYDFNGRTFFVNIQAAFGGGL